MIPTECVRLARLMQAATPAQKWDPETPDAWFPMLADFDYEDCVQVFYRLRPEQPFVDVSDVIGGVKDLYRERLAAHPLLAISADPDDAAACQAELVAKQSAVMRPHRRLEVSS